MNQAPDLQPLGDSALSEAAESGECGVVLVEAHGDVEAVALLLLLQADGERAPHSVAQPLALKIRIRGVNQGLTILWT